MPNNKEKRNITVGIKVSQKEYNFLEKQAKENSMTIPQYVREVIFFDNCQPAIEQNSFQFKVLRLLSFCSGILALLSDKSFTTEEEQKLLKSEINKITSSIGIDPDTIKKKK